MNRDASLSPGERLENYTLRLPSEVLLLYIEQGDSADQVVVFKGYSSSLMHATAADPSVPVLSPSATIYSIDRLRAPYTPQNPVYLERQIPWSEFVQRLLELGL